MKAVASTFTMGSKILMESAMHDVLAKLKLTAEEEEILKFEEDVDEEKADQIALSLIGKLHTVNSFNIGAIKATFKKVWKPARRVVIKELDQNLFLFQFFSNADKAAVMNEGPWAFDDRTLLLKELTVMEKYSDVVFETARFWVKVYDVPALKQTKAFVGFIANKVGKFVNVDENNLAEIDKSLNFIADININKPLGRDIRVKIGNQPVWFDIRYVKLSDFCYACGMLGHVYRGCEAFDDSIPEDKLPYGPNMRASPVASKRRGREVEKQKERQL